MGDAGYTRVSWVNYFAGFATVCKMPVDAVFSFFGHGKPGYAYFWDSVHGLTCIRADNGMAWPSGVNTTWSSSLNETSDLQDLRLMMLEGCETAKRKDSNYDYTSLTEQAVNYKGVDCAVGFTTRIYAPEANSWDYYFWAWATEPGTSVAWCCQQASLLTYYKHGQYHGTNNWDIKGNGNITIVPAAYGT